MNNKKFIKLSILITFVLTTVISHVIYYSTTTNTLYTLSQKRVIETHGVEKIVFVGGSSLEYGLDAKYFSELSGIKSANLSLTATAHNLSATYNIIRHIVKNNRKIEIIVIMQTPFVWSEEFSLGGYCSTLNNLDSKEALKLNLLNKMDCLNYHYGNFGAIKVKYRQLKRKEKNGMKRTYKNSKLDIDKELLNNKFSNLSRIGSQKEVEIKMINDYIKDKNVTLIYVQGSIHYQLSEKYFETIQKQQNILKNQENIIFIEEYLYPKNENMGNTENHVDKSYKREATQFYYKLLKKYIQ